MPRSTPTILLPFELWDKIFEFLPEERLLTAAIVCRGFNELCVPAYLLSNGIPADAIAEGDLSIPHRLLPALQLAFSAPVLKRLTCAFPSAGNNMIHDLTRLHNIVAKSPSLRELRLEFSTTPRDIIIAEHSDPTAVALFRNVLYTMCTKTTGRVVFVYAWRLWKYDYRSLSQWQPGSLQPRKPVGPLDSPLYMDCISSVSVRSATPSTIVMQDTDLRLLQLGGPNGWGSNAFSANELKAVLPHLTVPNLDRLHVETRVIDAGVLSTFVSQNPSITYLWYDPRERPIYNLREWFKSSRPLLDPPIAHPALTTIRASCMKDILGLLDCVGASPKLFELWFPYDRRRSFWEGRTLKCVLRRIALHANITKLALYVSRIRSPARELDAEEQAIARGLVHIEHVTVLFKTYTEVRRLFPWLALLPALQHAEFVLDDEKTAMGRAIIEEARAALPHVAEVDGGN